MKKKHKVLIKVSGDLVDNKEVFTLAEKESKHSYVVLICGAGTKINKALEKAGYEIKFEKPHGRIIKTQEEEAIVKKILNQEEKRLKRKYDSIGVKIQSSQLKIKGFFCPINGDNLVKAAYLGFNDIYVITLKKRIKDKKNVFFDFPKVKIIGI